jgi:hypothetical protein
MQFTEVFSREKEGIKALIFSISAFILLNVADRWVGLKASVGDTLALSIYGIFVIFMYIPVAAIYEWMFIGNKIRINTVNTPRSEPLAPPVQGVRFFIDLEVEIPKGWELTECYATLDKVVPVFYQDRKLLEANIAEWFAEKTNPKHRRLLWESRYSNTSDCTVNIVDSPKERFCIACVNIGSFKNKRKKVDVNWFEFRLCADNPTEFAIRQFGLYKVAVSFHWKRNGKRMIPKRFNGYVYSEPRKTLPYVIVGKGDYKKDKLIHKTAT